MKRLIDRRLWPILIVVLTVHVCWAAATWFLSIPSIFLPRIGETYTALLGLFRTQAFWLDLGSSWFRVTVAFLAAFCLSYPLVLGALASDTLRRSLFVFVEFFRYLPVPVFVPLTILWFGVADTGKIVVVFLGTFAQMIPMFYDSTRLARESYGATPAAMKWRAKDIITRIVVPGSAPYVFDNARICLGWAWTYLVVAELLGAQHGIGYAIIRAQRFLATDKIFAYVIVIGVMGIGTDRLLQALRRRLFRWESNG